MRKKTKIKSHLENIKNTLTSQLKKNATGIYLYIICHFLCNPKKNTTFQRLEQNHYKALTRLAAKQARPFLRHFISEDFKHDLLHWKAQSNSYQSKHPIHVRIDGTKTGYRYGKYIPALRKLYDYVKGSYYNTHELYVLLVSIGDKDYIVDYILVTKTPEDKKSNGVNALVIELLNTLAEVVGAEMFSWLRAKARISLDGAWGKEQMLVWFHRNHFSRVVAKSGGTGKILVEGEEMSLSDWKNSCIDLLTDRDWKQFNSCHQLGGAEYYEEYLTFKKSGLRVHAVILRFPKRRKKSEYRYLVLLSLPGKRWYAYQIVKTYKGRWGVETMFRTCKQYLELERLSYHTKECSVIADTDAPRVKPNKGSPGNSALDRMEWMISFRLVGYMMIQWYRVDHTRMSQTSLKQVMHDWETYLGELPPKTLCLLFSG